MTSTLGPDATGVGWVYEYALQGKQKSLDELRAIQDWYVRYQLTKAHGVAEVASIDGFVQTYQVTVAPLKLRTYGLPPAQGTQMIRDPHRHVGGRIRYMADDPHVAAEHGYPGRQDTPAVR